MEGVPPEDLARHQRGESIVSFKRLKVSEGGLLPLLAAQKASVPSGPDMRRDLLTRPSSSSLASGTVAVTGGGATSPSLAGAVSPPLATATGASAMISGAPVYYPSAAPTVATTGTSPLLPPVSAVSSPHMSLISVSLPPPPALAVSPPMSAPGKPVRLETGSPDASSAAIMSSPSSAFATITVPPSVDAATGKTVPGSIIVAPDLVVSMVSGLDAVLAHVLTPSAGVGGETVSIDTL